MTQYFYQSRRRLNPAWRDGRSDRVSVRALGQRRSLLELTQPAALVLLPLVLLRRFLPAFFASAFRSAIRARFSL